MITRTEEGVCKFYADITPFYVRDQCLVGNKEGQISLSHPTPLFLSIYVDGGASQRDIDRSTNIFLNGIGLYSYRE